MTLATVRNGADSWTKSEAPNENEGKGVWLRIQGGGGNNRHAFLSMHNPPPRGATVTSAHLFLFGVGAAGTSFTATLQRVAAKWSESGLTWTNEPGVTGSTVAVTQTQSTDGLPWDFDVTTLVQTMVNGAANYGFRLVTTDSTERKFYSLDAGDFKPVLVVEWSDPPDAPTDLSPAGGAAVTLAKPVLTFNYHDVSGDAGLAACRVQIKATNSGWTASGGFAAPDYDSETDFPGGVPTTDPEFDTSSGTFAGLAVSDTVFWTVQVVNDAGDPSPWSVPTSFTRVAHGTVTINSPTGGTVDDPTPTVIWTPAGATQTGWQVTVFNLDDDPAVHVYSTLRKSGAATSWTLPKGVIANDSDTFRVRVRSWFQTTRTSTPGDPTFAEAVSDVVFSPGVPTAPSAVAVSQFANGQPRVDVAITIASAPDQFVIKRSGVFLDIVNPADLPVVGTTYTYKDLSAAPNIAYTYHVSSRVGGVTGPTRTGTPNPFTYGVGDIWLADYSDPASSRLVPVTGISVADLSFDRPEIAGTYQAVNGQQVVRVVQSPGGSRLQGHVSGRIVARHNLTAAASVADMKWMRDRPDNPLRLTIGGLNLKVVIGNVVMGVLATGDMDARSVSFDWWEQV